VNPTCLDCESVKDTYTLIGIILLSEGQSVFSLAVRETADSS